MPPEPEPQTASERADLVAYLDGELPEDRARAVSARLTASAPARREAEGLEKSWELLDYLPRPRASAELTTRTLTLARLDPPGGPGPGPGARPARPRRGLGAALLLAGAAACFALGHVAARLLPAGPGERLARELTLAEDFEALRAAGSLEFLRRVEPAFAAEDAP